MTAAFAEEPDADQPADAPAARRISVRPAPKREPPFDDEAPQLRLVGPYDRPLPFEPWPGRLRGQHSWQAPRPTGRGELPDPAVWGRRILIAVLEARAGRRPLAQLTPYLSGAVHRGLTADVERHRAPTGAPFGIRSIHVCEPADGVAEIAAVLQCGPRYRAIAARLEGLDGRWRCVNLQIG
jgi:Family of unknown function (DUF6459)